MATRGGKLTQEYESPLIQSVPLIWREAHFIMKMWHADPLICPQCQHPMRLIAVLDQLAVAEKILRHLGLWSGTPSPAPARSPPGGAAGPWIREPCDGVNPCPTTKSSSLIKDEPPARVFFPPACPPGRRSGVPRHGQAAYFFRVFLLRAASARQNARRLPKPGKNRLTPAHGGAKSPHMNPTQKQFSLNRAASKKQIPISSKRKVEP